MEEDYLQKSYTASGDFYAIDQHNRIFFCENNKKEQITSGNSFSNAKKKVKMLVDAYNSGYYKGSY